jgi:hypothetical protein
VIAIAAAVLIVIGVVYAALCVAQLAGHPASFIRKPAVAPTRRQLRDGAIFGLVIAAVVVLGGVTLLRGPLFSGHVSVGVWLACTVCFVVGTLVLRKRHHRGGGTRPADL